VKIDAAFVTSAAGASGLPHGDLPEVAFIGRSNVGKSSLINALVRQRLARTSAAPGKTRLANVFRVKRGAARPFHLVDLPGYGYARGGDESVRAFDELTRGYFERDGQDGARIAALLLVDSRHPGLQRDIDAWRWLQQTIERCTLVATKIDKLARGERIRATRQLESVFETSVLPVSADTGEGLDELWRMIDRLANNPEEPAPPRRLRSELRKR
jgi:GTP-binding protein